ncbi:MAG TPA: hydrogenase maturation protease [Stellaceae bacterium]|nr:hydrogenase maturation protease [Stellaceae bacterium]
MTAPHKILVIGAGNPDRGDDGIGAMVARRLAQLLPADIAVLTRSGDMLSLIDDWAAFDAVFSVDAAATIGAPGRVHRIDLTAGALPREIALTSSHAFGLAEAIELAQALRLALPRIIVYAVEGHCFDAGAAMTPEVAAAAGVVADRIIAEIATLRQEAGEVAMHA